MSDLTRIPSQTQIQPLPKLNDLNRSNSSNSITTQDTVTDTTTPRSNPEAFKTTNTNQTPPLPQPEEIEEKIEKTPSKVIQSNKGQISQLLLEQEHPTPPMPPKDNTGMNSISDILKTNFSGIEKGLRGAFKSKSHFFKGLQSNSSLLREAQTKASRLMQGEVNKVKNGQHSDLIFHMTTKTKTEFRNEVIKSVSGMREGKYGDLIKQAEFEFKPKIQEYQQKMALYDEAVQIKAQLSQLNYVDKPNRDENWKQEVSILKSRMIEIQDALPKFKDNVQFKVFGSETAMVPDLSSLTKPVKPELDLYSLLSDNKKGLVDNIIQGLESIPMPNRVVEVQDTERALGQPTKVVLGDRTLDNVTFLTAGGGGSIFKATDEKGKEYILKISSELDKTKSWESMVQEGQSHYIAGMTNSPHILGLVGLVKYEALNSEKLMMVLEVGEHGDMDKFISTTLPETQLPSKTQDLIKLQDLRDIAKAIETTHEQGLIHLDIKPANVLKTEGGAKLFDFGEARRGEFSESLGTPEYMPPEVHDTNKTANNKTDVFSFGMMMYEMLIGPNPFKEPDPNKPTEKVNVAQRIIDFGSDDNHRMIDKDQLTPIESLINRLTHPNPNLRLSMTEALQDPVFTDIALDSPQLRELNLAISRKDQTEVDRLKDQV